MGRICIDRRCDLQHDARAFRPDEPVPLQAGNGIILNIHPPVIVQHIGNEHVTVPQWFTTSDPVPNDMPAAIPNIDDQTDFTRELFRHWDVHARTGPAHIERLLHVHTWFLHSGRIRVNDEERLTTLGDNFHQWGKPASAVSG